MKPRIRIIIKYSIDIYKVIVLKGFSTLKLLIIYQCSSTKILKIILQVAIEFDALQMIMNILQRII